jgi:hypothetical protein
MKKLNTLEIVYLIIAIALILVGLKFTSVGVGPVKMIQDDGYNVTGGFMNLVGGFILGALYFKKKK